MVAEGAAAASAVKPRPEHGEDKPQCWLKRVWKRARP